MLNYTNVTITSPTLQELKEYSCDKCSRSPQFRLGYNDADGLRITRYFCNGHYREFLSKMAETGGNLGCDWCGGFDSQYHSLERFGESSGHKYTVCTRCKDVQDDLLAEEFEEESWTEEDEDLGEPDETPDPNY